MISSISIKNYRNIKNLDLDFSKSETLILGKNGQGKTSILEAVFFLSIGKAYRAKHWSEAINFEEEFGIIEGKICNFGPDTESNMQLSCDSPRANSVFSCQARELQTSLFTAFQKTPRKQINFKVGNIKKKLVDFIGNFSAVLFSPEDLRIITNSPQNRRDFLDSLLFRLDKNYVYLLNEYQKVLKQRNSLLKKIQDSSSYRDGLEIWDEKFVELGFQILEKRLDLIEKLKPLISSFYKKISKKEKEMGVGYVSNLAEFTKEALKEKLKKRIERDLILGNTSVGPHRDDLSFFLDEKEMKEFASQGEIRTGVLAVKYSEIELLQKDGKEITLLLDDVFSELDEERQISLVELSKSYQTIITTTHLPDRLEGEKIYTLENGKVI